MFKLRFYLIAVIFLIFSLFEFLFLQVLPNKLNLNSYVPQIKSVLEQKAGVTADFGEIKFDTFSDFSINLNADFVKLSKEKTTFLDVQNINVRVYLLPLLLKKLHIRTISADDIKLLVKRDKNGVYTFSDIELDNSYSDFDLKVSRAHLFLKNYDITFQDDFYKNYYNINGSYFFINKFQQDKFIDMSIVGDLKINNKEKVPFLFDIKTKLPLLENISDKKSKLNISLPAFDLKYLEDYIKEYFDTTLEQISGNLAIDIKSENQENQNSINSLVVLNDIKYLRNKKEMSVKLDGKSIFTSEFIVSDKVFDIRNLNFMGDFFCIHSVGKIFDYLDIKKVKTNLEVEILKSRAEALYWALPSEIPLDDIDVIRRAKEHGFFADVVGNIKINGKGMEPDVLGKVDISNIYVVKPFAPHVPKATIVLDFKGDYLYVNSRSFTDSNQYVDVIGDIELYGEKNADLHILSTEKVDLLYTYQVLIPIHQALNFELGPVPVMTFYDGYGNIDLKVKGNKVNPSLIGYFQCFDTSTSLNGLNAKLTDSSARLDFNDFLYHFETVNAFERGYPIIIKGDGDLSGKLNFDVIANNFPAKEGFEVLSKSDIFSDFKQAFVLVNRVGGVVDFIVNLKGQLLEFDLTKITDELTYSADVKFRDVLAQNYKYNAFLNKINGQFAFDEKKLFSDIKGLLNNAKFNVLANSDFKKIDVKADFKSLDLGSLSNRGNVEYFDCLRQFSTNIDGVFSYSAPIDKFYEEKVVANLQFKEVKNPNLLAVIIPRGSVRISNNNLDLNDLLINFRASEIGIDGKIYRVLSKNFRPNIVVDFKKLEVADISAFISSLAYKNDDFKKFAKFLRQISSSIVGKISYVNDKLNGDVCLKSIILNSDKLSQTLVLGNVDLDIVNNNLEIKPFTFNFYQVPTFFKGEIKSLNKNPKIDLYLNSRITSVFFDEFVNNYLSYPVKLKGESVLKTTIRGGFDNIETYVSLRVPANSDLSYMNVNLGDAYDDRELFFNGVFNSNQINIKNFNYKKYIATQNNYVKPLHIITASGILKRSGKSYKFSPFSVKTISPASAKLFNMIFKKSIIKSGLFECDLKLTGNVEMPFIEGNMRATNVEAPFYDAVVRDFDVNFSNMFVDLFLRAKAWGSEFEVSSVAKNSLALPLKVYSLDIISKFIDLDKLEKQVTKIDYADYPKKYNTDSLKEYMSCVSAKDVVIEKGSLRADDVLIRKLNAKNLNLKFSLNEKSLLKVSSLDIDLADGDVNGELTYDFNNTELRAKMFADDVNAQTVVKSLFFLEDQIFGVLDGSLDIKTSGYTEEERLKNLIGKVTFNINDGRMPKLGSLEYLLRAANLVKSGITGVSINSIIQLLLPMHSGDFSKIHGEFELKNGMAKNMQIYTRGESLKLYLTGSINLINSIANLEVWGALDKYIKTPLGPLGNASINSVFSLIPGLNTSDLEKDFIVKSINKIPGIEVSNDKIRVFRALINGDINSDKFVEKFEWVKN